ncbi:HesA/MoeB/ThiF family protein [Vibrio kyushuensis]|uniref:HesA/MoeB/ThiF family protein n=1 Tax=Vibrio kyushuensis TaxID=2910249 RepID=UPI003D0D9C11
MLSDKQFLRYQRQVCLPDFGDEGQTNLLKSQVLIIGCGGLGSSVSLFLAAAGVGSLVIVDDDVVESSNLQRQVIYREEDIGSNKARSMRNQIGFLNSDCRVRAIDYQLKEEQLALEVSLADLVLDCTDNFESRHLINRVCSVNRKPLVSGAAIGWQGQFIVFSFDDSSACYQCLYPADEHTESKRCADMGIIGPVVGTIGNLQALASIQKLALGEFKCATEVLQIFDGSTMTWQNLSLSRDATCKICGSKPNELSSEKINNKESEVAS